VVISTSVVVAPYLLYQDRHNGLDTMLAAMATAPKLSLNIVGLNLLSGIGL
jgi:hypothetical protein